MLVADTMATVAVAADILSKAGNEMSLGAQEQLHENGIANGHVPPSTDEVPAFGDEPAAQEAVDAPAEEVIGEPVPITRGLYFVRVPRPNVDESAIKKLTQKLVDIREKIKGYSTKMAVKRRELGDLRKQNQEARSLKDGANPEYDQKMQILQAMRKERGDKKRLMGEITANLKGLDAKSETELDNKIKEMEHKMTHEGVPIAEERKMVQLIAKLNQQRERVREYEGHKETLTKLETETKQLQAMIKELEGDFNVLKSERDQVYGIMTEIRGKRDAAEKVVKDMEEELGAMIKERTEIEQKLDAAREAVNEELRDYKENRNLGLQVRDLVAAGQVEQARVLCLEQAEVMMTKLNSDAKYRAEYTKLWGQQRKYIVSELLPESGPAAVRPAANAARGGARAAPAKPGKPQGALKAAAIIASAMEEANRELQEKVRLAPPATPSTEEESDEPEPEPVVVPVRVAKPKPDVDAATIKAMSEIPVVTAYDADFKVPVTKDEGEQLSAAQMKERIRDEQRAKAAEAEMRKKKRQEVQAKKKEKGAQREQERAKAAAEAATKEPEPVAQVEVQKVQRISSGGDEAPSQPSVLAHRNKHKVNVKALVPPAVPVLPKAKSSKDSLAKKAQQIWNKNMGLIIFALVMLFVLIIGVMMA